MWKVVRMYAVYIMEGRKEEDILGCCEGSCVLNQSYL
jgi:hypothetical protein